MPEHWDGQESSSGPCLEDVWNPFWLELWLWDGYHHLQRSLIFLKGAFHPTDPLASLYQKAQHAAGAFWPHPSAIMPSFIPFDDWRYLLRKPAMAGKIFSSFFIQIKVKLDHLRTPAKYSSVNDSGVYTMIDQPTGQLQA